MNQNKNSNKIYNNSCSDVESVPVPKKKSIQSKSVNVVKKNSIKKMDKKTSRKNAKPNKSKLATLKINENEEKQQNAPNVEYVPYKYDEKRVNWKFRGVQRSSTMIFIGNLPYNIKEKAVQFFVMKKAKISMRQIEETQIKQGSRGKYALIRFRSDVAIDRIQRFMDKINAENNAIIEEQRKSDNIPSKKMKNTKKSTNYSWQKRVFLKFNETV